MYMVKKAKAEINKDENTLFKLKRMGANKL